MNKIYWPPIAAVAVIVSFFLFIGLTWLWYFAGNSPNGIWSDLTVLGLMHLSFWGLFIAGMVWLVQLIRGRS